MYYYLNTILKKEATLIEFQGNTDRLFDYFVRDAIDGEFLKYVELKGIAQEGMNEEDIEKCDFLSGIVGLPIFSERFVEKSSSLLNQECMFYPIEIKCKNKVKTFYLTKINCYQQWIDYDNSGFRTLVDGSKMLDKPIVTKAIHNDFYLIKDTITKSRWAASENLKKFVEEHKLNIEFEIV